MNISAVAKLTGLHPVTVRSWERRYGAVLPSRDSTGRRIYSKQDVERLSLLSILVRKGHRIGGVAGLDITALREKADAAKTTHAHSEIATLPTRVLEAAAEYNMSMCHNLIGRALISMPPLDVVEEVLAPVMASIGEQCSNGGANVAQEHLLTGAVTAMLSANLAQQRRSDTTGRLLVAAPGGDMHDLGCLFVAFVATSRGADCINLGANVPAGDLIDATKRSEADALALHVSYVGPGTIAELEHITESIAPKTHLWIGGHGANRLCADDRLPDACPPPSTMASFANSLDRWALHR